LKGQQEVVAAFLAAARTRDFDALLRVLDPNVVSRADFGKTTRILRGAEAVVKGAMHGAGLAVSVEFVLVNGGPGCVAFDESGNVRSVVALTVRKGKIVEIDVLADPERLRTIDLGGWKGEGHEA
jgi:RNA polymerase sigma-70 factor (ECF subfamily)